jgi:hypothetical protein
MAIVLSIIGILVCGVLGGTVAWAIVAKIGLSGTPGALVAAVLGMIAAFLVWVGGSSLLRVFGRVR